jgi:NitT/TauT family transport system substrate-binding protein
MFSTFKRFALVVGLASICFAATASAQTKITVAYVPVADFLPAFVAKEKGFFERNGLEVTLKPIIVASNIPPAMVAGDVQIGLGTGPNMMMANENGLDLVSIYGITRDTTENPISSLIVRKSSGIKEAKDFIGKKVAVPGLNSVLDIFTREWLKRKGVNPDQVTFVELPMPQLGDVLKAGTVDAITVIEPFRGNILRDPESLLIGNVASELRPDMMMGYWQALRKWSVANEPAIKAFRASLDEGLSFIRSNDEETRTIAAKYLRFVPPRFPTWNFKQTVEDFQVQADITTNLGLLRKRVDVKAMIWK